MTNAPRVARILTLSILAFATSCAEAIREVPGECSSVFGGEICTWAVLQGETVLEIGATVPMASVENAPLEGEMVFPPVQEAAIRFPEEVRDRLGIDHLGVNWERHGHPPALFLTPHYDFHFYNVTPAEVAAIDCSDEAKASLLPNDYALPDVEVPGLGTLVGLCVPNMGMHAMLETEVAETEPFGASLLMGYYGGEPVFLEPMVSRDRLLEESSFTLEVPAVEDLPPGVTYPAHFHADYDAASREYRLILTGFPAG